MRIRAYLEQFDFRAAAKLANRLVEAAEKLSNFSERGRNIGGGIRQVSLVRPYLIRYRVYADRVEILTVRHGARAEPSAE